MLGIAPGFDGIFRPLFSGPSAPIAAPKGRKPVATGEARSPPDKAGSSGNPWKTDERNSTPAGVVEAFIRRAILSPLPGRILLGLFHGFPRSAAFPPLDRYTRGYRLSPLPGL